MNSTDVSITIIRRACDKNDFVAACNELNDYFGNLLAVSYFTMAREWMGALNKENDLPILIYRTVLEMTKKYSDFDAIAHQRQKMLMKATQRIGKMAGRTGAKEFYLEVR